MCIFCDIGSGKNKSEIVFEDELSVCFKDQNPQAPVHLLIIPKKHIVSVDEINSSNSKIVQKIFENIPKIAKEIGVDSYRIVSNIGSHAGQSVMHLHFHILGGRNFEWPPG